MRAPLFVFALTLSSIVAAPLAAQSYQPVLTPVPDEPGTTVVREYHPNGTLAKQHFDRDGKPSGLWQEWDADGRVTYLAEWRDGKGEGVWYYFHPNGVVSERSWVVADIWHGPTEGWHANGQRSFSGAMKDGRKAGPFRYWNEDGSTAGPLASASSSPAASRQPIFTQGWPDGMDKWEFTFAPDLETLFFATADSDGENRRIMMRRWQSGGWQAPEPVPFADPSAAEGTPIMGNDGEWLYFSSDRHTASEPDNTRRDLYRVSRSSGWMKVERITNTPLYGEISFSVAQDGSGVMWTDRRIDGEAQMGLYEVAFDGSTVAITGSLNDLHLGDPANENYAVISPTGDFVIFANYDVEGSQSGEDLYVARRTPDGWAQPVSLGPLVNTDRSETSPSLSPDGKTLFFLSGVAGGHAYFSVSLSDIPALAGL